MQKTYHTTSIRLFSYSKKRQVIIFAKNKTNFLGTFENFDTQSNFSLNYVIGISLDKNLKNFKLYKEMIINGSKISFFSIL